MTEQAPYTPPAPLSPAEERQWAMISHLSVLANLITGFLSPAIPLILYFVYKDRSRFVAFHAMQAFVMQVFCSFGGFILAVAIGIFSQFIPFLGLLCLPISCLFGLLPLAALVYGTYGGIQVNQGRDFKYWLIGDWVQNTLHI